MRLQVIVDALKAQRQDSAAAEPTFHKRLGMRIDQQWNWRESQALGPASEGSQTAWQCVDKSD
jgi:hypothetical protein